MSDAKATSGDRFEEYNYEQDRIAAGGQGKGRTKREAAEHASKSDSADHTRKVAENMSHSHDNEKEQRKTKHPQSK